MTEEMLKQKKKTDFDEDRIQTTSVGGLQFGQYL
jgi:hypothetical protein